MNIIYETKHSYITSNSNGDMYVVVGFHGRLMITRDYNKALECCNAEVVL